MKDNFGRSQVRVPGLIEGGENLRVLLVTTVDKQGFTQVQAPWVEVKTLLPACLICIDGVKGYKVVSGEM